MAKIEPWYLSRESAQGEAGVPGELHSVYHDNDGCREGEKVPKDQRAMGTGKGLKHCPKCAELS